ncbi:unnamed protein product [Polarella glacialis]|uniref:Uncharacterized protein n=1 Tax=Polarella glacialis TaxID=89957 RepID=A0A813JHJ5_POLGL|nr:unnamed protein product [Polarella glacialis]
MFPAQSLQVDPFVVPAPQYQQLKLKESQKLEKPGGSQKQESEANRVECKANLNVLRLPGLGSRFEAAAEDCSEDDFDYSAPEPSPRLWKSPRQHVAVHLQGLMHQGGRLHQFQNARVGSWLSEKVAPPVPAGPRPHEARGRGGRHRSVAGGQPAAVQHQEHRTLPARRRLAALCGTQRELFGPTPLVAALRPQLSASMRTDPDGRAPFFVFLTEALAGLVATGVCKINSVSLVVDCH